MKVTFTPEICKDKQDGDELERAAYEGSVTLRVPTYCERLEIYDGLDVDEGETPAEKRRAAMKRMRSVAKIAPDFVERIAITRKADGFEFDSWQDLECDTTLAPSVIPEIVAKLIDKFEVGKDGTAG